MKGIILLLVVVAVAVSVGLYFVHVTPVKNDGMDRVSYSDISNPNSEVLDSPATEKAGDEIFCKKNDTYRLHYKFYIVEYLNKGWDEGFTVSVWEKREGGLYYYRNNLLEVEAATVLKNVLGVETPLDYTVGVLNSTNATEYGINLNGCIKSSYNYEPASEEGIFFVNQLSGQKGVIGGLDCYYLKTPVSYFEGQTLDCINKEYCEPLIYSWDNEFSSGRFNKVNLTDSFDESIFDIQSSCVE